MGVFNVNVNVLSPEPGVLYINVNPESVPLDGRTDNTIVWTMKGMGTFSSVDDIQFLTTGGQNRFNVKFDSESQMSATINGVEEDQTIYTYYLTVHLVGTSMPIAIRIDPEVDNPPPPPGP